MKNLRPYQVAAIRAIRKEFHTGSEPTKKPPGARLRLDQMNPAMREFCIGLRMAAHIEPRELHAWMAEKRHELALGYLKMLQETQTSNTVEDFLAYARRQYQRARGRAI